MSGLSERRYQDSSAKKLQNFTDVCMVGGKFMAPTIQTCLEFGEFEELYIRKFSTNHFQTWRSSQRSWRIFLIHPCQKLKKKPGMDY